MSDVVLIDLRLAWQHGSLLSTGSLRFLFLNFELRSFIRRWLDLGPHLLLPLAQSQNFGRDRNDPVRELGQNGLVTQLGQNGLVILLSGQNGLVKLPSLVARSALRDLSPPAENLLALYPDWHLVDTAHDHHLQLSPTCSMKSKRSAILFTVMDNPPSSIDHPAGAEQRPFQRR